MPSSILYQFFGIRQFALLKSSQKDGIITLNVEPESKEHRCSNCQSTNVICRGYEQRTLRTVPCGGKPVEFNLPMQRVGCRDCSKVRQAVSKIARPYSRFTYAFERYAFALTAHMTIKAVANHLQVSWDAIKTITKQNLTAQFSQPRLGQLNTIAIDEISIGHGHRYLTVVLDLESGAVVFIGEGKGANALDPFWKRLKLARTRIEAVATDLSPAYLLAVRENLPKALHVADHFHFVKLFNERLAHFRRDLQREAVGPLQQNLLKGTRWLILKNPENLSTEKGRGHYKNTSERERLDLALQINKPLATAYYMKEEFRNFWDYKSLAEATKFLDDWIKRAEASCLSVLLQMASTCRMHRNSLLNYYHYQISTGPLEGLNNKIKTLQRQAYGFKDQDFFKLRIYAIHKAKYELLG